MNIKDAEERRGASKGGCALTLSVVPGRSRSSNLHRTTPSFNEDCRNPSGSEMVFFGDSKTPSVMSHVTVCSAGFMATPARSTLSVLCLEWKSIITQPSNWAPFSRNLLFDGMAHYVVFSPSCSIEMSNAIPSPPFPLLRQAVKRLSLEYSQCSKPASSASHLPADDITAWTALCEQSHPACFAFGGSTGPCMTNVS